MFQHAVELLVSLGRIDPLKFCLVNTFKIGDYFFKIFFHLKSYFTELIILRATEV